MRYGKKQQRLHLWVANQTALVTLLQETLGCLIILTRPVVAEVEKKKTPESLVLEIHQEQKDCEF